jgi:hypothetical protein
LADIQREFAATVAGHAAGREAALEQLRAVIRRDFLWCRRVKLVIETSGWPDMELEVFAGPEAGIGGGS